MNDLSAVIDVKAGAALPDHWGRAAQRASDRWRLRLYQERAMRSSLDFVFASPSGSKTLLAGPCACGKGTTQLATLQALQDLSVAVVLTTPSIPIIRGNLERLGVDVPERDDDVAEIAMGHGIFTPVRLVNRIASGDVEPPSVILADEVHSFIDDNTVPAQLFAILADAKWVGYTATPYRATQKGTDKLLTTWGDPQWMITAESAVEQGFILAPEVKTVAIVDDDAIKIVNGELDAKQTSAAYSTRIDALADLVRAQRDDGRRVVVAVSSTAVAQDLQKALYQERGTPAALVLQDTPGAERARIYDALRFSADRPVLIQIRVLSVGADLPELDCLVDAQPTMSPVLWLQTVGRIQRRAAGKRRPLVIVTNRNAERHIHLLGGIVPGAAIAVESQEVFKGPTQRGGGARALGFENLAAKKTLRLKLTNGGWLTAYALAAKVEGSTQLDEFFVAFRPGEAKPLAARRAITRGEYGQRTYAKWVAVELPRNLEGFATSSRRETMSDKQAAWWRKAAESYGLAAHDGLGETLEITGREFAALPAAKDCGWSYVNRPARAERPTSSLGPELSRTERARRAFEILSTWGK